MSTAKKLKALPASETPRPEVFRYHDYREFLRDWLGWRKSAVKGFSLRSIARDAGLGAGYLPMVLSGERPLASKAYEKLAPVLGLTSQERTYLDQLVALGVSDSQETRLRALERMKRFRSYRKLNTRELDVFEYLTRWPRVAIREMTALEDFRPDAVWIQGRLRFQVPLSEIADALSFLIERGFIEKSPSGAMKLNEKQLDCVSGVFKLSLSEFHDQVLMLAARAIKDVPSAERHIVGHTFALSADRIGEARAILEDALARLRQLSASENGSDSVHHIEMALFPLTKKPAKAKEES
jgi:uncharacterized protein (TIGR02147 family)